MAKARTPADELSLARLWEAIEPMRQEAYLQGWKDAIGAVMRSANTLSTPPGVKSGIKARYGNGGGLPAPDSNFGRVLSVVEARPGMTGAEAVRAVAQAGHDIKSESVRACLQRLQKRWLVQNRESKWFPASSEVEKTAGPSTTPDPAA